MLKFVVMSRHWVLLCLGLLYIIVTNIIWIAVDTRPPFWDMAYHQITALRILDAFSNNGAGAFLLIPQLSGGYPLLYPTIVACFYGLFGASVDVAQAVNFPAIALLMLATYGIALRVLPPMQAAWAGVLVIFYPYMLWLSRETVIEYWLSSLVALAILALYRTNEFSSTKHCFVFGVICGLGMLTKTTFVLYVAVPALWFATKNLKNAAVTGIPALLISSYWLLPQWTVFQQYLSGTATYGRVEGDPEVFTWQSILFYVRTLEGYEIFLPLFLLFIAGLIFVVRGRKREWIPILLWIAGGSLALLLIQNKDPRFYAPLLAGVAVISAAALVRVRLTLALLVPLLLFQHYLVSFGIGALPEAVVLVPGTQGFFDWNWNLYTQRYFGLWGPPAHEDWRVEHVLSSVTEEKRPIALGMIPTIPRFDPEAFEFYIALRKYPVVVQRLWDSDVASLTNADYVVLSENDQGYATLFSNEMAKLNAFVMENPGRFQLVERFSLPNAAIIRLYKVQRL
jgi:4-amino-4-deoxy-L-arabinose transferase-like glycosyltransferase